MPISATLRDEGIRLAIEHAERVTPGWKAMAMTFLHKYAMTNPLFSGEQVRQAAVIAGVPTPPNLRAWGAIIRWGAIMGIIKQVGTVQVSNPKAHKANAALWQSDLVAGVSA